MNKKIVVKYLMSLKVMNNNQEGVSQHTSKLISLTHSSLFFFHSSLFFFHSKFFFSFEVFICERSIIRAEKNFYALANLQVYLK